VKRVYYGWWLVAVAMLIYMLVCGSTMIAFGLYVLPVSADFKLSRADANTGLILINLGNALLAPFMGRVLDRVPVRRVMIACALVFGASFAILSVSNQLWLDAVVLGLGVPAAYLGAGSLTNTVLIARWFEAQRGRAMALAGLGILVSNITVTPVVGWIIEHAGWRHALVTSGIVITALLLPLALVVRERPGPDDLEPGRDAMQPAAAPDARPAKVGSILRAPAFWTIALGTAAGMAIAQTLVITIVPLAQEHGQSMTQASSLLSAAGVGGLVGTLLLALFADRLDRVILLTAMLLLLGLLNAALLSGSSYELLLGVAALEGVAGGVLTPTFFALLADRFGAASFGTTRGLSMPVIAAMNMTAVRFAGEVFDRTGAYELLFHVFIGLAVLAAALMFATRFTGGPAAARASAG
jgi:predicted MFS family arabinose efflux permease